MNRVACPSRSLPPQGKLAVVLLPVSCLLGLGGLTADQVRAATAQASATVIAPASVMRSLADLPVTVVVSGGWVRLALAPAGPPPLVSSLSAVGSAADSAVAVPAAGGTGSPGGATAADLRGEFATSLSSPAPLSDGVYRVTVAFN